MPPKSETTAPDGAKAEPTTFAGEGILHDVGRGGTTPTEETQQQENPSPTQSEFEEIEQEASNQMHGGGFYRGEEDEAESSSRHRTRQKSRPSTTAASTAATAVGLAGFFGHRNRGSANAQSPDNVNENLPIPFTSGDNYSYMSILWNLFLLSMDLKWVSKQLTKPHIQCMDCQTFQSEAKSKVKAKANAPFLEPEAEPQKGQFRNGPRQNIAGQEDLTHFQE